MTFNKYALGETRPKTMSFFIIFQRNGIRVREKAPILMKKPNSSNMETLTATDFARYGIGQKQ